MNAMLLLDEDRYGLATAADRRFRRMLARIAIPMLAFAIAVPLLHPEPAMPTELVPPPRELRRVELLPLPVLPKPVPVKEKPLPPAPKLAATARTPAAPAAPAPSARALAESAGLMQLRDQLAAMNDRSVAAVERPQAVISGRQRVRGTAIGASLDAGAAATSGGVAGAGRSGVSSTAAIGDLGARRTGRVQVASGNGSGTAVGVGKARAGGRGLEDIQLGFDRSKHSFNAIFSRAARESVGMRAGRVVVSLSIAPDGSVTRCELVSSAFGNPELEQKLLRQIRQMNFGARDVPSYTLPNYPIDYLPS